MGELLDIHDLSVSYESGRGRVKALDSLDLKIDSGEFLAVVGESGCGKTTLGLTIIGLLPPKTARITDGSIGYKGVDLAKLNQDQLRPYRGSEIAMVFQEPLTCLNPLRRVGDQIAEAIVLKERHKSIRPSEQDVMQKVYRSDNRTFSRLPNPRRRMSKELLDQVTQWLNLVRIADPSHIVNRYPFELSGGMRQRVMIAMALSQSPELLIADEPTTALDVTTQAQVLKLMKEIKDKLGTTIMLVTHDLAVASQVAERVLVMYAAQIVEDANVYEMFSSPQHPYTQGLLSCIPKGSKERSQLTPIPGSIPDLTAGAVMCRFQPRCPYAMKVCAEREPALLKTKEEHRVACFLYGQ